MIKKLQSKRKYKRKYCSIYFEKKLQTVLAHGPLLGIYSLPVNTNENTAVYILKKNYN